MFLDCAGSSLLHSLSSVAGVGCSPGLLSITGAGSCSPSLGAALHRGGLGGCSPFLVCGEVCSPLLGAAVHRGGGELLSIMGGSGGCSPYRGIAPLWCLSLSWLWSPSSGAWLSSCDAQALLPYHMWSLPGPGIKPMPPVLAGWFSATGPPGTSSRSLLMVRL